MSTFFKITVSENEENSDILEVKITDFDAKTIYELLRYIHRSQISDLAIKDVKRLCIISIKKVCGK